MQNQQGSMEQGLDLLKADGEATICLIKQTTNSDDSVSPEI
jgi:hypothetical protein